MFGIYYISHLLFITLFAVVSMFLFLRTQKRLLNSLKQGRPHGVLMLIVTVIAVVMMGRQLQIQKSEGRLSSVKDQYDTRVWDADIKYEKGAILDRSGKIERALARSRTILSSDGILFKREHPLGAAAGHLTGYLSRERGRAGMEAVFVNQLKSGGINGGIESWKGFVSHAIARPEPRGRDIHLTIDSRLQQAGYSALAGRRGAIVAIDPETGEIYALVSTPGFDPEAADSDDMWRELNKNSSGSPLFNRAINGLYPPGSTFKIVTGAIALGVDMEPEILSDAKGFKPENASRAVHEHERPNYVSSGRKWPGHGLISMRTAFKKSSNVYFADLANRLSARQFSNSADKFSFNRSIKWNSASVSLKSWFPVSDSNFPGESELTSENAAWAAIGQYNVLVTPLHMALVTATIANGGHLLQPSLELGRYPKSEKILSGDTSEKMREHLRAVVSGGTGFRANVPGLEVAGKTGTAENSSGDPHSWFVSFAPYNSPELVVVVVIENGGYGSIAAAKAARAVYEKARECGYFRAN